MTTLKTQKPTKQWIQKRLEEELERLKLVLDLNLDLKVVWTPNADKALSGEVKGRNIFIYESDEEDAVKVLSHEVIDYLVSQAIEPYKEVTNKLIKIINDDAYNQKEKVVATLARLLMP